MVESSLHIAMYPWLAMGHLTPFLHLANKLAKKGHRISFLIPTRTRAKLEHFNGRPDLITFVPIAIPQVEGLPPDAETTSDVPYPLHPLIMTAMDQTEPTIRQILETLKPHCVFHDFTHWLPAIARDLGIKSVHYCIVSPVTISYTLSPARHLSVHKLTEADYMVPPAGFPDSSIKLHLHEARSLVARRFLTFGSNIGFSDRMFAGYVESDILSFRSCREIEQPYIEYLKSQFKKPVLLSGPVIPEPSSSALDEKWVKWLGDFEAGSVVYCAFGSECTTQKDQFQELLLGLELTGLPFLAALKPPFGTSSIEEALPDKFEERVQGRGIVYGGWVPQQLILQHPAIGCFITHCGSSSLIEALVNKCQLVLLPQVGDQIFNARMMGNNLKVGVEVEKGEEDGRLTKDSVWKAVRTVMDEGDAYGSKVRENHAKIKEVLLDKKLESTYIDCFDEELQNLLH
ncbi:cyanidin 3-O-galactoside 2''-O-xylosyltransferase FGGT1-like [Syzygium oleosum]|uniref:cyanidin 3-O-galactoside 2''-O-xylosyltransferase FGGT1-like n=1 Tax=Syzygium oleosum TaxID=219896 RepID=UPI0011D212A9|nr:cyanidin 3-O-galactoside 2''-O-xylosyltransferase FGGT1-like [Syzygium oleosum]